MRRKDDLYELLSQQRLPTDRTILNWQNIRLKFGNTQ